MARDHTSKAAIVLWLVGLGLTVLGFSIANSEEVPGALALVSPRALRLRAALQILEEQAQLNPSDKGFRDLVDSFWASGLLKEGLSPHTSDEVLRFRQPKTVGSLVVGPEGEVSFPYEIEFADGSIARTAIGHLKAAAVKTEKADLICWALSIFVVGIFLQVLGFAREWREHRRARRLAL